MAKKSQAVKGVRHQQKTHQWREKLNAVVKLSWLKKAVMVSLVLGVMWWAQHQLSTIEVLPISTVKIEGEFKYLSKQVLKDHALPHVRGGFFTVDLISVREALLELPWVEDVSIRRQWPDALSARVMEKIPVAYWNTNKLLSSRGELFEPKEIKLTVVLPEIVGQEGQHKNMLEELGRLQAWLADTGLIIQKMKQDARRSWTLTMTTGLELRLGRDQQHERLHRFVDIYDQQLKKQIQQIKHIDMRYTNGFAVALRQDQGA